MTPQTDTLTVDLAGLDVLRFDTRDGTTVVMVHTDERTAQLNLGIARGQDPARVSLLDLLLSAYASGMLAAWNAGLGYDEDGNLLADVGDEVLGV